MSLEGTLAPPSDGLATAWTEPGPQRPEGEHEGKVAAQLRVLLVCDKLGYPDALLHGGGRLVLDWTRGLVRAGVDATTVVLRHPGRLADELASEGLPIVYLGRSLYDPLAIFDLVRIVRGRDIQVMHLQGYGGTNLGRIAARFCDIPAVVHIHSDLREYREDYGWWLHAFDLVLGSWTASCLAVSHAAARSAIEVQGFPEDRMRVLFGAVDPRRFRPPDRSMRDAARKALDLDPADPIVLCIARLFPVKGVDQLLDAWVHVTRQSARVRLLIAGDGPERATLEARARELGISGSVHFLGHRLDVEKVAQASDVVVIPSRSESGPLTAVEAMATGIPVVGFRVGGVEELVWDGEQGLLVSAGDIASLARAVLQLLSDAALRERMGRAALERSRDFGIDESIADLVTEYRRVIR
jgi:glycosyltransferase involved in cell wall biosynthesis